MINRPALTNIEIFRLLCVVFFHRSFLWDENNETDLVDQLGGLLDPRCLVIIENAVGAADGEGISVCFSLYSVHLHRFQSQPYLLNLTWPLRYWKRMRYCRRMCLRKLLSLSCRSISWEARGEAKSEHDHRKYTLHKHNTEITDTSKHCHSLFAWCRI